MGDHHRLPSVAVINVSFVRIIFSQTFYKMKNSKVALKILMGKELT